ncbi:hypothetical protein [Devosia riboflavina]|uniref:hypothetical protein n=1 Tax=Devosia riboflavina TaxID=46914 RepID=UPI001362AF93|nr:hypothetical protein [Devosia riboflavina]
MQPLKIRASKHARAAFKGELGCIVGILLFKAGSLLLGCPPAVGECFPINPGSFGADALLALPLGVLSAFRRVHDPDGRRVVGLLSCGLLDLRALNAVEDNPSREPP